MGNKNKNIILLWSSSVETGKFSFCSCNFVSRNNKIVKSENKIDIKSGKIKVEGYFKCESLSLNFGVIAGLVDLAAMCKGFSFFWDNSFLWR